jgi:hypothetical protein
MRKVAATRAGFSSITMVKDLTRRVSEDASVERTVRGTIAASSARAGISIARKPAPSARGCPLKILLASSGHGSFGVGDCARAPGGPHGAPDCDGGAEYYAKHGSSHVASFARIATLKTPGVTACITPIRARHTRRWHCVHYSPQKGSTDPFPTALHCVRLPI